MKINYDAQLITTSLTVTIRERTLKIDDVIIDTGSSHTIISPDVLEEIGVITKQGIQYMKHTGLEGVFLSTPKSWTELK